MAKGATSLHFQYSFLIALALVVVSSHIHAQSRLEPVPASYTIVEQANSPVKTAYVGIHPPYAGSRMVSYSVTNHGTREIRSLIIQFTRRGRTDSIFLGVPSSPDVVGSAHFMPAGMSSQFTFIDKFPEPSGKERTIVESEDSLTLKADYVLFQDGSSWGPDSAGMSETLLGIFDGQKRIAAEAKKLIDAKDEAALRTLIMTDGPPADLERMEGESRRQAGIRRGYGAGIILFRSDLLGRGDLSGIPARIRDIEREVGQAIPDDNKKQISVIWGFGVPIRVTGLDLGGRSIAIDERFSAEGDWVSELSLKIQNTSGKTVTAVMGSVTFPETRGVGGMKSLSLRYGPHPLIKRPTVMDGDPPVAPGESLVFKVVREKPGTMFLTKDFPGRKGISRGIISIEPIVFDDGTRWAGYQWQKQDPDNPDRWILIEPQTNSMQR